MGGRGFGGGLGEVMDGGLGLVGEGGEEGEGWVGGRDFGRGASLKTLVGVWGGGHSIPTHIHLSKSFKT